MSRHWSGLAPLLVFVIAFLLQLPLATLPGYFSHDELQWAWRAHQVDWVPWWDARDNFQFRPLTFNLWLLLSRAFFDTPPLFHSVLVAWGSLNATLLFAIARRFGLATWPAVAGALGFVLSPYAAYVHGWVGTIADLAWVSCGLLVAWCTLRLERPAWIAMAAFGLAFVGVLGKEAAGAIPLLCAVAWCFDATRRRRWLAATIGSGLAIAAFVAWRLPALLHAPRDGGAHYLPQLANVPLRWFEFQVFPPVVPLFEVHAIYAYGWRAPVLATLFWLGLLAGLWVAGRRWALAFLLGGFATLAPALLLGGSANQYGYGFAAFAAVCTAAAWVHAPRLARLAMAGFVVLTLAHGVDVMLQMREVASVQAQFSPALARQVRAREGVVRLRLAEDAKAWIFLRLTHEILGYDGVEIGDRVRIVAANEEADFLVEKDGRLVALRP